MFIRRIIISCTLFIFSTFVIRGEDFSHSYMYWVNSIKEPGERLFAIETSCYNLVFDYNKLDFHSFGFAGDSVLSKPHLSFGVETTGFLTPCNQSSGRTEDCQLIHTGRYLQHRFMNWIPGLSGCDPYHSGLDIMAFHDRLSITLNLLPMMDLRSNSAVINLDVPEEYTLKYKDKTYVVYQNPQTGKGFVLMNASEEADFLVDGQTVKSRYVSSNNFKRNQNINFGLIIYPLQSVDSAYEGVIEQERNPVQITANQYQPVDTILSVQYEPEKGWHRINLRNDIFNDPEKDNDRMERIIFEVENKSTSETLVRLNFSKEGNVFGITGISGIIRDLDGFPTGIPVQLSKNWHTIDYNQYDSQRYRGPWYHGIVELVIPAKSKKKYEYTSVNAMWGGLPAVSHAQLCLVGWGQNQQWDQSAIGAWGESICYEPDLDQASAPVLDIRPLFVLAPDGQKWSWTGNVGGADFFNLKLKGKGRAWHTSMRTTYKRNCPNLTEVVYAGHMLDHTIDFSYATTICRSDDYVRGIYKIRMDVRKDIEFDRLDFVQMAASTYHYSTPNKLAVGNENGLIQEWISLNFPNKEAVYGPSNVCKGEIPWFSFADTELSDDQKTRFKGGNRGMVLRKWKARLDGKEDVSPYWQECPAVDGTHGPRNSYIAITSPVDCHWLRRGDYVEAEVEMLIFPLCQEDYYGTDNIFSTCLNNKTNWELVLREAVGNTLKIQSKVGETKRNYPVEIEAKDDVAEFTLQGGVGYIPLTIKGISGYKKPVLMERIQDKWIQINQEKYGNDYWQVDRVEDGTYEFTFNIKSSNDKRKRYFKFQLM